MVDDLGEGNGGPMMGWSDYFDENTISFALEGDVNEAGDDDKLEGESREVEEVEKGGVGREGGGERHLCTPLQIQV